MVEWISDIDVTTWLKFAMLMAFAVSVGTLKNRYDREDDGTRGEGQEGEARDR